MAQNFLSDIKLGDSIYIRLGDATNGDLQIYHDGTNNFITSGTAGLYVQGDYPRIQSSTGENYISANPNAEVNLYYDNSKKFETTSAGAVITGKLGVGSSTISHQLQVHNASGNGSQMNFTDNTTTAVDGSGLRVGYNGTYGQVYLFENAALRFGTNNTERAKFTNAGHFIPGADSTYDLGLDATRWRNVYADTLYGDGSNITGVAADKSQAVTLTVKNKSGGSLSKGTIVHAHPSVSPPSGNVIEVIEADNDDTTKMPAIGILNETLADEAEGEAIMFGRISGISTTDDGTSTGTLFSIGDELYVSSTPGLFTNVKPTGTKLIQKIGVVIKSHATNGTIEVFGAGRTNDVPTPIYIDHANQRVGIGETTPDNILHISKSQNASTTLQIENANTGTGARANLHLQSDASRIDLYATSSTYNGVASWIDAGVINTSTTSSGGLILNSQAGGIKFQTGTNEYMRITSGGLVGINGTPNTAQLHIHGTATNNEILRLEGSYDTSNPFLSFYQNGTRRSFIQHNDSNDNLIIASEYGLISFKTATDGSEAERMRIASDGTTTIKTDGATQLVLNRVDSSIFADNTIGTIQATADDPTAGQLGGQIQFTGGGTWSSNYYPTNIVFSNDSSGTLTERMRIASNGTITFNAYTTAGLLQVNTSGVISTDTNTYLTTSSASSTYVPKSGGSTLSGGVYNINTNTNTNTLNISRGGSDTIQVMKIGITDTVATFNYIEDTTNEGNGNFGQYRFILGGNDGETSVNALILGKSNATFAGDVTVTGDLIVNGTETILNTETVQVEDNIIQLNRTPASPNDTATAATSGISIYRGNAVTEASFIFDDADNTWDLTDNLQVAGTIDSGSITSTGIVKTSTTFQSTGGSMLFYVPNVGQALEIAENTGFATFEGTVKTPTLIIDDYGNSTAADADGWRLNSTSLYGQTDGYDKVSISSVTGNATFEGDVISKGYIEAHGEFYSRGSLRLLNKAANGWLYFATRDTSASEAVYNLSNVGTIVSGAITSSGASSGRYTGLEVVNTTNASGTETAIGLGVVSAANSACDVNLVANRVAANSGSDFYIEQTNSSGALTETFRIAEDANATFWGDVDVNSGQLKISGDYAKLFFVDTASTDEDAYIVNNANGLFFGKTNSPSGSNDILSLDLSNKNATFAGTVQAPYITANNPSGAANGSAQEMARFVNTLSGATSSYMYIGASSGTDWRLGKNIMGTAGNANFGIATHSGTTIALEIDTSLNATFTGQIVTTQNQITTNIGTTSAIRLKPTSTTNTTGKSSIFLGTSPVDNYGISLRGARLGTDGTPTFELATHFNSANGTVALSIDTSQNATFAGDVTADSFIKDGGTSSQYLMADGSVSTSVNDSTKLPLAGGTMTGDLFFNVANQEIRFTHDSNGFITHNVVGRDIVFKTSQSSSLDKTPLILHGTGGHATLGGDLSLDYGHIGGGTTSYMLPIGFNRHTSDGTIINSSYSAYQLHNYQGSLKLQVYNSAGTFQGQHSFDSDLSTTFAGAVTLAGILTNNVAQASASVGNTVTLTKINSNNAYTEYTGFLNWTYSGTGSNPYTFNLVFDAGSLDVAYEVVLRTGRNGNWRNHGAMKDFGYIYNESDGDFKHNAEGDVTIASSLSGYRFSLDGDPVGFGATADNQTSDPGTGGGNYTKFIRRYSFNFENNTTGSDGQWEIYVKAYNFTGDIKFLKA